MDDSESRSGIRLVLVCNDVVVRTAVAASCPPPTVLGIFPRDGLLDNTQSLSAHGWKIVGEATESEAVLVEWAFDEAPALNTLCFHIRAEASTPVVALCRSGGDELVAAIAAGADDATTFPVNLPLVRAHALSYRRLVSAAREPVPRRSVPSADVAGHDTLRFGGLVIDRTSHRFFVRGESVDLTPREFALITFLIERPDTLCSRDQILDRVWGIQFDTGTNMVDVYMHFIRRKLEAHGLKDMLETVRGHGYRLVLPQSNHDPTD